MEAIAEELIRRHICFSIEKPAGVTSSQVHRLAKYAEESDVFASIPFVYRVSDLCRLIKANFVTDSNIHYCVRNVAGAPDRYEHAGVPWMLEREKSGGGCAINLAVHFIDLFRYLTKQPITESSGMIKNIVHNFDGEDYASICLEGGDNTVGLVQVGYTYPQSDVDKREFYLAIGSKDGYVKTTTNGVEITRRGKQNVRKEIPVQLDTDTFYYRYVGETLERLKSGMKPVADLYDMYEAMIVIDRLYARN